MSEMMDRCPACGHWLFDHKQHPRYIDCWCGCWKAKR